MSLRVKEAMKSYSLDQNQEIQEKLYYNLTGFYLSKRIEATNYFVRGIFDNKVLTLISYKT